MLVTETTDSTAELIMELVAVDRRTSTPSDVSADEIANTDKTVVDGATRSEDEPTEADGRSDLTVSEAGYVPKRHV